MLSWVGKRPLREVRAFPAQLIERFSTDWRSMVDVAMIDTAYDGSVFNVALADIPERKTDLVEGSYEVELPSGSSAPIAVKITDMLGEEVLVVLDR